MRRNQKKWLRILLTGTLAGTLGVGLAGCSLPNSNENTSITADETGMLTETVVEAVEEDSFTEEDLKSYIEQEIADYSASGGGKVSLTKCSVTNSTAETVMTYETCEDYANFNHVACFLGTIQAAEDAGYDMDQAFVDKRGEAADKEVISERAKEWKVFICEEPVQVKLPDKILYATDNVTITGRLTATVNTVLNDNTVTGTPQAGTASASPEAVQSSSSADGAAQTSSSSQAEESVTTTSAAETAGQNSTTESAQTADNGKQQVNPYATVSDFYAYIIYK